MDGDDELVMVIIDGEAEETTPRAAKLEPAEEVDEHKIDLELILQNAKKNGEYLGEFNELIEEGKYLSDGTGSDMEDSCITEVRIERLEEEEMLSDSDESDKRRNKSRPKVSYVAQLQKNFPKMRRDEESLVSHLTELMKHTKPPPPPIEFCKNVDGQLVCSFCFAVSTTLPIAGRHYQKKHGTRYLTCYACGADFKCTTGLYKHEKRCSSEGARIVLMARGRYLGRKGKQRPYLTLGKFDPWDQNNPNKRHSCKLCKAEFSVKEALEAHLNVHRGVRPYQCDQCPVGFSNIVAFRRHLEVRHSDKVFTCDTCERPFKAKTSLIAHLNTHLPPKHPCDRCDRRFTQKTSLRFHIERDHLHIPLPHACTECPKRFPRLFNLKCHLKKAHGMTLMTRQMFIKALPNMKEEELKKATIVFNNVGNKTSDNGKLNATTKPKNVEQISVNKDKSDHVCLDITYRTAEMPNSDKKLEEIGDPYLETFEYGVSDDKEESVLNDQKDVTITSDNALNKIDKTLKEYLSFHAQEQTDTKDDIERKTEMVINPIVNRALDAQISVVNLGTPDNAEIKKETLGNAIVIIPMDAQIAEEIGTPNDAVVRTVLPENCEIEFARIGDLAGESVNNNIKSEPTPILTEVDENTVDFKIGDTDVKVKNNISEDLLDGLNNDSATVNKIATNAKKGNKKSETPNKKVNIRKTVGTRSNVMKTRSGMKIYSNKNIKT